MIIDFKKVSIHSHCEYGQVFIILALNQPNNHKITYNKG